MQDKGLDMQDPKRWEKVNPNHVLTEELVSCAAPATITPLSSSSLPLLLLLLQLSCTENSSNKHVGILLLPPCVFPAGKRAFIFEGNSQMEQEHHQLLD